MDDAPAVAALARRMAGGALDPATLMRDTIAGIERAQPTLHAFIHIAADNARAAALRARDALRRGERVAPLHGVPVALKDVIDVAGQPTTANSRTRLGMAPAARDSTIAARLAAAGAIVVGKLHCWELSVGGPCDDTPFPPARNPWDPSRDPGGSSSGAAVAVAAGLVPAAIGGDTGGSIRLPAAYCGVVGFKPSFGLVPMDGVVPFAGSLDVVGPLARSAADAAIVTGALAGRAIPVGPDGARCRVGIPVDLLAHVAPAEAVARSFEAARRHLERIGVSVVDVRLASAPLFNACYFVIARSEAFACWCDLLERSAAAMSAIARRSLAMGALLSAADLVDATRLRRHLAREMAGLFDRVDMLCLPTTPDIAGPLLPPDGVTRPDTAPYTRPFSLVGAPAISLPCGLSSEGMPVGLQIVGRFGDDAGVLGLAHRLETSHDWPGRNLRPDPARWM
ncbi:MAG: amidase [Alphaproteobacteria bacterium]|nr:amidase [Alphaproteobacteria bacterium]